MKHTVDYLLTSFIFLITFTISSQDQGIIHYKASFIKKPSDFPKMKEIEKTKTFLYQKSLEIDENVAFLFKDTEFILEFKNQETTFGVAPSVAHDKNSYFEMLKIMTKTQGIIYQNLKTNEFIRQTKGFGKTYLIELEPVQWTIHTDTKKIGNYNCYKATAEIINTAVVDEKYIWEVTAWFAPEIPLSSGPAGYSGLPGLILEADFHNYIKFEVTKLDLAPKKEIKIKKPIKGVPISEEGFIELDRRAMQNIKN